MAWRSSITGRYIEEPSGFFAWFWRWFAVEERDEDIKIGGSE